MIFGAASMFYRELTVVDAVKRMAGLGYGSVEVWMEHLADSGDEPGAVRAAAEETGVMLTVHAYSYDLNIAGTNAGIRRESLRQMHESVSAAVAMNARVVVIHPGRLSSSKGDTERYWELLAEAADEICSGAPTGGPVITLEAMERGKRAPFSSPESVARFFEKGDVPETLGLTIDIAHMYTVMDPVYFLRSLDPAWIRHVHLSDGDKGRTHTPLGRGTMGLQRVMRELERLYDGIVSLEAYVPGKGDQTLRANRDYLQRLGWGWGPGHARR